MLGYRVAKVLVLIISEAGVEAIAGKVAEAFTPAVSRIGKKVLGLAGTFVVGGLVGITNKYVGEGFDRLFDTKHTNENPI